MKKGRNVPGDDYNLNRDKRENGFAEENGGYETEKKRKKKLT